MSARNLIRRAVNHALYLDPIWWYIAACGLFGGLAAALCGNLW